MQPSTHAGSAGSSGAAGGASGVSSAGTPGAGGSGKGGAGTGSGGAAAGVGGSAAVAGAGAAGGASSSGAAGGSPLAGSGGSGGGAAGSAGELGVSGAGGDASGPLGVLVFSRTQGFRHDSIPDGIDALVQAAPAQGWTLMATEDPTTFDAATLARVAVVVFLSTTGDVLDDEQQAAFESFVRAGGGFVGIHSATDTEYDWAFYGELVGAYFKEHPAIQSATVRVEDAAHTTMQGVPAEWTRTDEWYGFKANPRPSVHVLMTLDESSYDPGTSSMGSDHPITWLHEYEGGRAFYTALGHTKESYSDPVFVGMLTRAIEWAAGRSAERGMESL